MAKQEAVKKPQGGAPQAKGKGDAKGQGKAPAKSAGGKHVMPAGYVPAMKKAYSEKVIPHLQKQFGFTNPMLIPHLEKITLNIGIGNLHADSKLAESIAKELSDMTGQKPVFTRAKKSISNFKLRQGMIVGCRVTLRRERMYEFLERLIGIVIPRMRDFRGLNDKSFDGRGNYTFGIKEQIVFPEIDYDKVVQIHGLDITISTSARNDEEALELLRGFGFPFKQRSEQSN